MDELSINYRMQYLNTKLKFNDVRDKFIQLKTHEERFALVLETVVESSDVLFDFQCPKKSSEHSKRLREAGNMSYVTNQFYKALQEYTEGILFAVGSSEELAVGYANRSAALFKLDKYEDCVEDIDRALILKYPDRLKTKLYRRKGLCLMSLGRPDADSSFQQALAWIDKMNLSENERRKSERELRNLISVPYSAAKLPQNAMKYELPEILTRNPKIPCASDAVSIKYSDKFGRHVVATRRVKPGEILVVEDPYCRRLISKHRYTNCSYCFVAAWAMIPCDRCVNVAYCSETCKANAWDEHHQVECSVVGSLQCLNVDDPIRLTLRMAIMATKKGTKLDALRQELIILEQNTDPCDSLYCDDGILHNNEYRSIHVCTQMKEDDDTAIQNLLSGAVWVAISVCILAKESEMLGKKLMLNTLARNPDVIFLGGLMLKHLHLGAQIKTHRLGLHSADPIPMEYGHALMAIGSLFNHSCDANTARQWNLGQMVIYAVYPIEAGEQMFDNYGSDFTMMMRSQRRENFKRWKFYCDCRPCTENWPLLHGIPSYKVQRLNPLTKKKINKAVQKFKECKSLTQKNALRNEPNTFDELVKMIEILFTLAKRPCRELTLGNHLLKFYYAATESVLVYEQVNPSEAMEREFMFSQLKQIFD